MKTLTLLALLCLSCFTTQAADGVTFFQGNWQALLDAAQQQQKLIFIDVYTDWCPPCKQMDKEVLPLASVGNKYNPVFMNYKLNAEKGEGIALAKKYGVTAYPTYLYLDSKGRLLHRAVGFNDPATFNAQVDKAVLLSKDKNFLGNLEDRYQQGDRDVTFVRSYIEKMTALGMDNSEVLNAYFKSTSVRELSTEEGLIFLGNNINNTKAIALQFFIAHYDSLSVTGKQQLAGRLYPEVFRSSIMNALEEKRYLEIPPLLDFADKLYISVKQQQDLQRIRMIYFTTVKDIPRVKEAGYKITEDLMAVPVDSAKREDARRYQQLMAPFLSGQQDSTKIENFAEERKTVMHVYSREIGATLYFVATSFADVLDRKDAAWADALKWATRGMELNPGEKVYVELVERLKK